MVERALDNPGIARAFLRICGTTVGRQQLAIALGLGCERIVCIAPGLSPELVDLQHTAEAAGARFHVVANHRSLAALVTAADEIFAIADGLLVTRRLVLPLLEQGAGVLVQPIEQGLAGGFERIDINTAAAGAMRVPGRLVSQLNDLPPDCDAYSTLQRIALQSGTLQRSLPASPAEDGFWTLVESDRDAHEIEPAWIRARIGADSADITPGRWLALHAIRMFGAAILDARSGRTAILSGVAVLAILSLVAGFYGFVILGISLAGAAWLGAAIYALLKRIEVQGDRDDSTPRPIEQLLGWALDAVFVVLAGWGGAVHHWQPELDRFFPPLMLFLVLRLAAAVAKPRLAAWLGDRMVLAVLLGCGIASGFGSAILHGSAVLLAGIGLLSARGFKRIT